MSSKPQRSLRLEKRSSRSLSVLSGAPGEIFFDNDNGTLRVYTDTAGSSIILANRQWVTDNTFDGNYNSLTNKPVIPTNNNQLANGAGYATTAEVDAALSNIDTGQIDLTGYATETYVDNAVSGLTPTALEDLTDVSYTGTPQTNDVLTWNGTNWDHSPATADLSSYYTSAQTDTAISTAISNFQTTIVDAAPAALDTLNELAAALNDDANFATTINNSIAAKQATLVSGTNIKTINSTSLLGSGNLSVQPTLVSGTNIKTINSTALLGSGDITVQPTLVSGTNIKTINGTTILGSGDLVIATGNPFNQDLNTTDDVEFNSVTSGTFTSTGTGAPVITSASTITLTAQDGVTINGDLDVTGTVTGITLTAADVGLGNVTNESKATMFTSPTFTGSTNARVTTITGNGSTGEGVLTIKNGLGGYELVFSVVDSWYIRSETGDMRGWPIDFSASRFSFSTSDSANASTPISIDAVVINNDGSVDIAGDLTVSGLTTLQETTEVLNTKTGATGTVVHDFSTGAVFYHTSIASDFTANFINVPTTNDRTISIALILVQGTTAYIPNALQIEDVAQTILWQGGSAPTGTATGTDIVSFTLIRVGSAWKVIGSGTSYS